MDVPPNLPYIQAVARLYECFSVLAEWDEPVLGPYAGYLSMLITAQEEDAFRVNRYREWLQQELTQMTTQQDVTDRHPLQEFFRDIAAALLPTYDPEPVMAVYLRYRDCR